MTALMSVGTPATALYSVLPRATLRSRQRLYWLIGCFTRRCKRFGVFSSRGLPPYEGRRSRSTLQRSGNVCTHGDLLLWTDRRFSSMLLLFWPPHPRLSAFSPWFNSLLGRGGCWDISPSG